MAAKVAAAGASSRPRAPAIAMITTASVTARIYPSEHPSVTSQQRHLFRLAH